MKLVIDLPDWCDERHIFILAGIEMAAYKLYGEDFINVKISRCSMCGQCCEDLKHPWVFNKTKENDCEHLQKQSENYKPCGLGVYRPWTCCVGLQQRGKYSDHPRCTVEYESRERT